MWSIQQIGTNVSRVSEVISVLSAATMRMVDLLTWSSQ